MCETVARYSIIEGGFLIWYFFDIQSFSTVLNSNMGVAKKEYYIWVYWNCCPMNRHVTVRIVLYTSFSFRSICTEFVFVE